MCVSPIPVFHHRCLATSFIFNAYPISPTQARTADSLSASSSEGSLIDGEDGTVDGRGDPSSSLARHDSITRFPFIQLGNLYPRASEIERLRGFLPPVEEARQLAQNYVRFPFSFFFFPARIDVVD